MTTSGNQLIYPTFFKGYVDLAGNRELITLLEESVSHLESDLNVLKNVDFDYAYDKGKWTIGQLLQHCIDAEQIFAYRAMTIARADNRVIRSFDENQYAAASVTNFNPNTILQAMLLARKFTCLMYKGFESSWLERSCLNEADEYISVRSLGYIAVGHWLHHCNILSSRYQIIFSQAPLTKAT